MSLFRAEKLIDLACSTTHTEEARTAALTACRLIRQHGFRLTADPQRVDARAPQHRPPARTRSAEPVREKPPNGGTWRQASRSGRCENCSSSFAAGDEVYVVADVTWCSRH
ncbi:MAG: hypothetical protein RL701_2420 [Pseudomonadota bacterium]